MEGAREKLIENYSQDSDLWRFANGLLKRALDIAASALGLILLAPFFLFVAWRIRQDDSGPVFYRGERLGLSGRVFRIWKFRTMYERPESYQGARITAAGDKRVTPFGRWLRSTKLNELPQLLNVLAGDMSLVGPRPEDPEIVGNMPPAYRKDILSVRPGITSPASVIYHDEEARLGSGNVMGEYLEKIMPDKMRMDLLYVRHNNIFSDLDTIFWTFIVLIPKISKQKIPEGWLFGGPLSRFVRHYFSWFMIDFIIALTGISLVGVGWRLVEPLDLGVANALVTGIVMALIFSLSNSWLGVKTVSWNRASAEDAFKLIFSCFLMGFIYQVLHLVFPTMPVLPSLFVVIVCITSLTGFIVARYRLRLVSGLANIWVKLRHQSIGVGERVLIVGAGNAGDFVTLMLRQPDFYQLFQVVGFVDDSPGKQGMRLGGHRVLGTTADIPFLAARHNIGVLFFSIRDASPQDKARILNSCRLTHLPIVQVPDVIDTVRRMFADSIQSQL